MTLLLSRRLAFRESTNSLSAAQLQMDAISHEFTRPSATHLLAMTGASLFGRVLGLAASRLTSASGLSSGFSRALYHFSSLPAEVLAYRAFTQPSAIFERQGLLSDLLSFGLLKSLHGLSRNTNLVLAHSIQNLALVAAQNMTASLGWTRVDGSLVEQFFHAGLFNLQQGAALGFLHHALGRKVASLERNMEVRLQARTSRNSLFHSTLRNKTALMASEHSGTEVHASHVILEIFAQARQKRFERIRERLETEANPRKRAILEEEIQRLDSHQLSDVKLLMDFFDAQRLYYTRNIFQVGLEGLRWAESTIAEIFSAQTKLGAYDLFVRGDRFLIPFAINNPLPDLQRWARAEEAPLLVRVAQGEHPMSINDPVYINLRKIRSTQSVVSEYKIGLYQEEALRTDRLRRPGRLSLLNAHEPNPIYILSDGNHHALAALRAGYDFMLTNYAGRETIVKLKPILVQDLKVMEHAEFLRFVEALGHNPTFADVYDDACNSD